MSKAEKRALEKYPKETRDITGFVVDIGHPQYMHDLYIEGYHQAEKDLGLTIEDIKKIHTFLYAVKNSKQGVFTFTRLSDEKYQEVLKRFKERKEE